VTVWAVELPDAAARAFEQYVERAQREFVTAATQQDAAGAERDAAPLRDGKTVTTPGGGDGIIEAPSSLIHHWRGRAFAHGVTLDEVLAVSRDYASYAKVYRQVIRAQVVSEDGPDIRIQLRMRASGGGLTATLDVLSRAHYVRLDARRAYVVSRSESIREVKDAGQPTERQLPEGQDSGYLWRAATFTRVSAVGDGVVMEMETLGLSRPFPRGLGWIIEPIARRFGRRSVDESLEEFRRALPVRGKLAP
jgi:hypothetical protein